MTLIELLVTIVILVTLLAAVLPAVSPNNEGRRIREASRQLVSLFAQAQAQAARDGRSIGVGFNDAWNDADSDGNVDPGELRGYALEAYMIAEPPPFSGFSIDSSVAFFNAFDQYYAPLTASAPAMPAFLPPIVNIVFGEGTGIQGMMYNPDPADLSDAIPPRMFRGAEIVVEPNGDINIVGSGDIIAVGDELFEIVINDYDDEDTNSDPDVEIVAGSTFLRAQKVLTVRWLTWRYRLKESLQTPPQPPPPPGLGSLLPKGGREYRIRPQAVANVSPSRTAAQTIQFPRGVGIDIDVTEGNRVVGLIFSPSGSVDAVYEDGRKEDAEDPIFIMLGRVENGHPWTGALAQTAYDLDPDVYEKYDFRGVPNDTDGDEVLAERRRELNMLNPDSRWVVITPAGRVVTTDNAIFDPRTLLEDPNDPPKGLFLENLTGTEIQQLKTQRGRYRFEAQLYARQLDTDGGG